MGNFEEELKKVHDAILEKIDELYALDSEMKDLPTTEKTWANSCHMTEAIRGISAAVRHLEQIDCSADKN